KRRFWLNHFSLRGASRKKISSLIAEYVFEVRGSSTPALYLSLSSNLRLVTSSKFGGDFRACHRSSRRKRCLRTLFPFLIAVLKLGSSQIRWLVHLYGCETAS